MADPFDDLWRLVHPDRLLTDPRATGTGVRVAVIDTGVDRAALAAKLQAEGRAVPDIPGVLFLPDRPPPAPDEGKASAPHGTTVADVILTVAPEAQLFSADVFGPRPTGDFEAVVRAIYHALDVWRCRVINISLGIPEGRLQPPARRWQLQRAVEEAYHRGAVIVAAAPNDHPVTKSYPAAFSPALISVDKGLFDDPLDVRYQPNQQIEFQAHGRGYWGPFAREPATSWAAPHVSGLVARLLSLRPDLHPFEIKTLIAWMARARHG